MWGFGSKHQPPKQYTAVTTPTKQGIRALLSSKENDDTHQDATPSRLVGVRYFPATAAHAPLRIYYPAAAATTVSTTKPTKPRRPVRWFHDLGVFPYLQGYFHLALAEQGTWTFALALQPLSFFLSWVLPLSYLRIPNAYKDLECVVTKNGDDDNDNDNDTDTDTDNNDNKNEHNRLPLIVFSHGLTGTGQENQALFVHWAQQGYVVVSVHHTDGSSCRVQLADGTWKYYEKPPKFQHYDATFRPNQIQERAQELLQAYRFLVPSTTSSSNDSDNDKAAVDSCPQDLQNAIDPNNAVVAGFSYGAATAARVAVMDESPFRAALFLDGWFYIDIGAVSEFKHVEFSFPAEAFTNQALSKLASMPTFFLLSQQFQQFPKLLAATQQLATAQNDQNQDDDSTTKKEHGDDSTSNNNLIVLPNTGHQNFCDVVVWFPLWVLKRMLKGMIGDTDPVAVYQEIMDRTTHFLNQATKLENDGKRGLKPKQTTTAGQRHKSSI
ncbi:hypothetical protein ACA910_018814 [Epithemia clementina (nom. ined.)]